MIILGLPRRLRRSRARPGQDEARAHQLQAPPAEDHEGALPDQPEPGLQGAQDVVTKDGTRQKGFTGKNFFLNEKKKIQYLINQNLL